LKKKRISTFNPIRCRAHTNAWHRHRINDQKLYFSE
jgi:hypothetical protein